jgi:ABC-type sugar transport system permease subunit
VNYIFSGAYMGRNNKVSYRNKEIHNYLAAFWFLLPLIILLVGFMAFPIIQSFIRAVHDGQGNFIGLYNLRLFLGETRFITNVRNTFIYVIFSVLLIIPTALLAANLIVEPGIFVSIIRPLYLIPWVIPYICSSILFRSMFYGQGPVSYIVFHITGKPMLFLSNPKGAMMVIVLHQYWRALPFCMLFIAAGLTTIPIPLYEAATIDGAGKWKQFWHITLPILKSHIFIITIMATNGALQDSESIWSISGGGPGIATETIAERLFVDSFKNFDLNSASVLGVVLLIIASIFILLYGKSMKSMEEDIYE